MGILSYAKNCMTAKLDPFLHPDFGKMFESNPLVIYDVGAAGSVYCPIETGPCERVRVYGFEPVKSSYDELALLYTDNEFVEIRQAALSDKDGVVTLNQLEEGLERSSSLYSQDGLDLNAQQVEVESARVDSVPKRYGFRCLTSSSLIPREARVDSRSGIEMVTKRWWGCYRISFWRVIWWAGFR